MQRVRLGATGLQVSRFSLGTMTFGGQTDETASRAMLDYAFDAGVDIFDTANVYNAGKSEEILGRWIRDKNNRDDVVLASKVRYQVGDDNRSSGLNPKVVLRELERSLSRLGTDYLDIYYLHQPDDQTPLEVTWQCLDSLARSGKIRFIGLSNFASWQVAHACHLAQRNGWIRPTVTQPMYSLVARRIEAEFLPMARHFDLGNCTYNPLAGGLLTAKHAQGQEAEKGSRLDQNAYYRRRYWHPELLTAAKTLHEGATQNGRTLVELALRFLLDNADATNVLLGASRLEQLQEGLGAIEARPLSEDERELCDRVWRELEGPIPRYHRTDADAKLH